MKIVKALAAVLLTLTCITALASCTTPQPDPADETIGGTSPAANAAIALFNEDYSVSITPFTTDVNDLSAVSLHVYDDNDTPENPMDDRDVVDIDFFANDADARLAFEEDYAGETEFVLYGSVIYAGDEDVVMRALNAENVNPVRYTVEAYIKILILSGAEVDIVPTEDPSEGDIEDLQKVIAINASQSYPHTDKIDGISLFICENAKDADAIYELCKARVETIQETPGMAAYYNSAPTHGRRENAVFFATENFAHIIK